MLSLKNTQLGAEGVSQLQTLPKLTVLNLDGSPVSEAMVDELTKLTQLRKQGLSDCPITDKSAR